MTAKKVTTELERKYQKDHTMALQRHRRVVAEHKEGVILINLMPKELTDFNWYTFGKLEPGKWYLETWGIEDTKADEFIKKLKLFGIYGIKSRYRSFNNSWEYKGSIAINGTEVVIKVDGGSKPQNCRIEETKEMKEVITFKAICEETEEEL